MAELLRVRARGIEIVAVAVDSYGDRPGRPVPQWMPQMLELFDGAGVSLIRMAPDDDVQAVLSQRLRPAPRLRL